MLICIGYTGAKTLVPPATGILTDLHTQLGKRDQPGILRNGWAAGPTQFPNTQAQRPPNAGHCNPPSSTQTRQHARVRLYKGHSSNECCSHKSSCRCVLEHVLLSGGTQLQSSRQPLLHPTNHKVCVYGVVHTQCLTARRVCSTRHHCYQHCTQHGSSVNTQAALMPSPGATPQGTASCRLWQARRHPLPMQHRAARPLADTRSHPTPLSSPPLTPPLFPLARPVAREELSDSAQLSAPRAPLVALSACSPTAALFQQAAASRALGQLPPLPQAQGRMNHSLHVLKSRWTAAHTLAPSCTQLSARHTHGCTILSASHTPQFITTTC